MPHRTIGQLAAAVGVGVETIRFYERQGLIVQPPKPPDGFRHYPDETLRRLRFIVRAKQIGFALREIRELLSFYFETPTSCAEVRQRAQQKIDDLQGRITSLQKMSGALEQLVTECDKNPHICPILANLAEEV